jgi:hypothetical protein
MRKYLLPESGNFYKANLHCHTTVSDGSHTPEAVKELYKAQGYSIIAYTDHDIMIDHDDLRDEGFLPLLGYEMEITEQLPYGDEPFAIKRTCHMCLIARDRETAKQVCWHRSKYLFGHAPEYIHLAKFDENIPDYNRSYSPKCINDMIAKAKEGNFFVTYNHPKWSLEGYPEYSAYEGMDAMEMFNGGCLNAGYEDYNPEVYDAFLRQGKRLYCIGTDDNHGSKKEGREIWDFFRAFTMIKADKLEYGAVIEALDNGNFYASEGPEIKELYYEDGQVHIECSEAVQISMHTGTRRTSNKKATGDLRFTSANYPVSAEDGYFRFTIVDEKGRRATTNAYFLDEIL